jgi:hypothetical protein
MAVVSEKMRLLGEFLNDGQKQIWWAVVQLFGRQMKKREI